MPINTNQIDYQKLIDTKNIIELKKLVNQYLAGIISQLKKPTNRFEILNQSLITVQYLAFKSINQNLYQNVIHDLKNNKPKSNGRQKFKQTFETYCKILKDLANNQTNPDIQIYESKYLNDNNHVQKRIYDCYEIFYAYDFDHKHLLELILNADDVQLRKMLRRTSHKAITLFLEFLLDTYVLSIQNQINNYHWFDSIVKPKYNDAIQNHIIDMKGV